MANAHAAVTLCCFATQPFAECALSAITGASIPRINRYCMKDYALCPVYKAEHKRLTDGDNLDSTDEGKPRRKGELV